MADGAAAGVDGEVCAKEMLVPQRAPARINVGILDMRFPFIMS